MFAHLVTVLRFAIRRTLVAEWENRIEVDAFFAPRGKVGVALVHHIDHNARDACVGLIENILRCVSAARHFIASDKRSALDASWTGSGCDRKRNRFGVEIS